MSRLKTYVLFVVAAFFAASIVFAGDSVFAHLSHTRLILSADSTQQLALHDTFYVVERRVRFPLYLVILWLLFCAPISAYLLRKNIFSLLAHTIPVILIYLVSVAAGHFWSIHAAHELYGGVFSYSAYLNDLEMLLRVPIALLAGTAFWLLAVFPHRKLNRKDVFLPEHTK